MLSNGPKDWQTTHAWIVAFLWPTHIFVICFPILYFARFSQSIYNDKAILADFVAAVMPYFSPIIVHTFSFGSLTNLTPPLLVRDNIQFLHHFSSIIIKMFSQFGLNNVTPFACLWVHTNERCCANPGGW